MTMTRMTPLPELQTQRLRLRAWLPQDREPFARMNADPAVMEYFPALLSAEETDRLIERITEGFHSRGFGLWALEVPGLTGLASFAGFVGLSVPRFEAPFTPCVEIGWRLSRAHWGKGYATEAARAALRFGFESCRLAEIVSITAPANLRSRRVMEKLGMTRDPAEDFDHPSIPPGHPLQRHVLYRLRAEAFARADAARTEAP
jgi:RimJ/RimL family protein N-acetyltransferase